MPKLRAVHPIASTEIATMSSGSEESLSSRAKYLLDRLEVAPLKERRAIAEEVRRDVRAAVTTIGEGARSVFEAVVVVVRRGLHVDLGHGSPQEWFQKEVVPQLAGVSKGNVSKLRAAVRGYAILTEKYPETELPVQYSSLALLEAEWRRQQTGKGFLDTRELEDLERHVAEGSISVGQMESMFREKRKTRVGETAKKVGFHMETPAILAASPESPALAAEPQASVGLPSDTGVAEADLDFDDPFASAGEPAPADRMMETLVLLDRAANDLQALADAGAAAWDPADSDTVELFRGACMALSRSTKACFQQAGQVLADRRRTAA